MKNQMRVLIMTKRMKTYKREYEYEKEDKHGHDADDEDE